MLSAELIEGLSRNGRVKKYINKTCRDNHIHYTSLCLIVMHLTCSLSTLDLCVENITVFCTPQKANVGMYSGCDYLYKSTFWCCHPYFILQFYSIVFVLVSVLFLLLSVYGLLSIFRKMGGAEDHIRTKFVAMPFVTMPMWWSRLTKKAALGGRSSDETLPFRENTMQVLSFNDS